MGIRDRWQTVRPGEGSSERDIFQEHLEYAGALHGALTDDVNVAELRVANHRFWIRTTVAVTRDSTPRMGSRGNTSRRFASHHRCHPGLLDERHRRSHVTRELERLIRLLRLAKMRRDLIAITVVQSRVGRLTYAALEGVVARG